MLRPNLPLHAFLQESFVLLQSNESSILELGATEFLLTLSPKNKSHFVFERFNLLYLHPQGNPIKNQSRMTVTTAVTRKWFQKVKLWNVPPEDVYGQLPAVQRNNITRFHSKLLFTFCFVGIVKTVDSLSVFHKDHRRSTTQLCLVTCLRGELFSTAGALVVVTV